MKIFKYLFILMAGLMVFSCDDREIIQGTNESSPIVADLSANSIVLDKNYTSNPALTVTWSAAEYSIPVEVNYTVEISATETFDDPVQLSTVTASTTYITYSVSELNKATKSIGLSPDVAQKMYFRITAYLGSGSLSAVSNITSVTVTPYLSSPVYNYTDLYLIGSSTAAAWDNNADNVNMYPLLKNSKKLTEYTYTGFFKGGKDNGFKMVVVKGSWDAQYGLGAATDAQSGTLSTDGGSGNIPVPADGYYKLTIDTAALTYKLEPVAAPTVTYETVGIIGDATANGRDASIPMVQSSFDPHVWTLSGVKLTAGEMKFRANNAWDVSWGIDIEYFGTAAVGGANIPVSSDWTYDIYFNDATGDYTIIPNAD
ncbi:SusE domain-containing protein [Daejeonia sp. YH14]|uniref:SusE domain-containing protein n=1 Tax=Daejeonia sp. YH14 TaxID=3439042 RepID=UPI003F4965B8